MSAMEAARLREWYSAAQALVAELASKASTSANQDTESLIKHFQVYRLLHRIKKGAGRLKQGDSRAIWSERASTLQGEVHELTSTIIQNANQGLVPSLLAAGASNIEAIEAEKSELQESLQAAKYTCEALEATITEHVRAREQEAAALLELRTRSVVLQQDVQRREADARELVQRIQGALKEKEALVGEKERMQEDMRARAQLAESQGQVIAQLMADSEESKRELEGLCKRVKESEQEAHVLRVNLGKHGQVIEKLIVLNAEMMEAGNKYVLSKEGRDVLPKGNAGEVRGLKGGEARLLSSGGLGEEGRRVELPGQSSGQLQVDCREGAAGGGGSDDELPVSRVSGEETPTGSGSTLGQEHLPQSQAESEQVGREAHTQALVARSKEAKAKSRGPEGVSNLQEAPGESPGHAEKELGSMGRGQARTDVGTVDVSRKPAKWTSDMLPLAQRTTSPPAEAEMTSQEHLEPAGWVGSKIQGVGGKARGLFNYVAGMNKASAASV